MTALLFLHCGPQPDTFLKAEPSSFNCSPYFLSFILSLLFSFLLIVWLWLIFSPCSLPHLFSLKQFTCKTSTHISLPLCAFFSCFRLPGNNELSNCVFIGLRVCVSGSVAKCKCAQILVYLTSDGDRNIILCVMTHTDDLSDHINRFNFILLWSSMVLMRFNPTFRIYSPAQW